MFYTSAVILIFFSLLHLWLKNKYSYWKKRNVKGPRPIPFFGNLASVLLIKKSVVEFCSSLYKEFPNDSIVGVYHGFEPGLVIRDPKFIKQILIKDFHIFQDRGIIVTEDIHSQNLFRVEGAKWRVLRRKLSPIFTTAKIKIMLPLITQCVNDYVNNIDKVYVENEEFEIKDLVSKYTLEAVKACMFGDDKKSFFNEQNDFREVANQILQVTFIERVKQLLVIFVPSIARFVHKYLNVTLKDKSEEDFFVTLVNDIVRERKRNPKLRGDFMDLLIELKEHGKAIDDDKSEEIEIDNNLMVAQALVFYEAAFENTTESLSLMMYEMALNPDIQERAANEVKVVIKKYAGSLTYDGIAEMPYLTACFEETLRKYPILGQLFRKCWHRYTFPETNITIDKGTLLLIPVAGLHWDPQYFEDPEVFRPERFLDEKKNSIPPCAYIPFGDGPRKCIGLRFAKVVSIMGIAGFLNKFRVKTSSRTPKYLTFNRRSLALSANCGIWLRICSRKNANRN